MFLSSFRYSSVRYCTVPNSTVQLQLRYRTVPVPVGTVWYGTVPVRWYLAFPVTEIYPVMNNWVIEVNILVTQQFITLQ